MLGNNLSKANNQKKQMQTQASTKQVKETHHHHPLEIVKHLHHRHPGGNDYDKRVKIRLLIYIEISSNCL